jgi:predicted Zn-dependent peptidase
MNARFSIAWLLVAGCGGPSANVPAATAPTAAPAEAPAPAAEPPPAALAFPDEPFRAKQPPAAEPRALDLPKIDRYAVANGIDVYHVADTDPPVVNVDLVMDGGAVDDPPGKEGLASICMDLVAAGTETLDRIAFSEAQADIASDISAYASIDQHGARFSALKKHLDRTLDLWTDMLLRPGLRADELERIRARRLEDIRQQKGAPAGVSARVQGVVAWGPKHPYGRVVTEASVRAITLDDCKGYAKKWIQPKGARLFVVGDVTREEIEAKAGERLGGWKGSPPASKRVGKAAPPHGRIFFVDVPGAPQSAVSLVHDGPPRKAKYYYATRLLSAILGQSFSSRINMNIREDKGWAYGARGGFSYMRAAGYFTAGGSIVKEHTGEAVAEVLKEIEQLKTAKVPPTVEELAREKEGAILSLPAEFETGRSRLNTFKMLVYFGLPLDWYKDFVPSVQKVDEKAAGAAAATHLKPGELRVFVVGDGQTVLPQLEKLLADKRVSGTLVRLDADGKVVK